ncbi:Mbeg1-like protein [Butyrivibrio sp. VCB2006]|uniref:Mbeg1-like protein n=1 Tax=Butyrivibrio sp. VCB2006 TaxID=1280679 RepID=UPI0003FBBB28|nr:Mbeg1-like protein [Butyrivibrio sp. VCB2006]
MANIINYIKWRGDIEFAQVPFNKVDNLGLALLVYNDFAGIIPGKGENGRISISDAADKYFMTHSLEGLDKFAFDWVLYYMGQYKRFGSLYLSDYVDVNDTDRNMVFTAFTVHLPDGSHFVSFRGTTMEIDDWRMDFQISFEEIEAQRAAAVYLRYVMEKYAGNIYVGGHSKGGNLAVYAAMHAPDVVRNRIKKIYSYDGPGFCPEILEEDKFNDIKERIDHVVPAFCVVGMLFELQVPHEIVASSAEKIAQHSGMSWKIEGDHFVHRRFLTEESTVYNRAIDDWIGNATMEQRRAFTRDIFDAMKAGGAVTVGDISEGGFHDFGTILLSAANSESKTKIVVGKFFGSLWRSFEKIKILDTLKSFSGIIDLFLIFLGIIFMTVPTEVYRFLGGVVALTGAGWSAVMLLKAGVREENRFIKRGRMIFHIIILCVMVFILSNLERIPKWTNLLMAVLFLSLTFACIRYIVRYKDTISGKAKFWMMLLAVVNLYIGIISIAVPSRFDDIKSVTLGGYLIVVGFVRLIIQLLEQLHNAPSKKRLYYEEEDE